MSSDIAALYSWQQCPTPKPPSYFRFTSPCISAQYLSVSYCSIQPPLNDTSVCYVTPANPVAQTCALDLLVALNLTVSWADGVSPPVTINASLSCAPESLFQSLPTGIVGLASLSSGPLSLQAQFSQSLPNVKRKFAMCLPRDGSDGTVFFGDGPYNLDPRTNFDASALVSYVPLLTAPRRVSYAFGSKGLFVAGNSIALAPYEGISLTTVVPYTTMRSDVYNQFLEFFTEGMKDIPRVEKVEPFSVCYNATAIGYDDMGQLDVPKIELEFDNGTWTIYGSNSMKYVRDDVACLAILDGGEHQLSKIDVGSYQMEEYLLVFDDGPYNPRFGFSSSLYREGISCGHSGVRAEV